MTVYAGGFNFEIKEKFRKKIKENRNISVESQATKDWKSYVAYVETSKEIKDLVKSLFDCKWQDAD